MSRQAEKQQGYNEGVFSACANGGSQEATTNLMLPEITDDARLIICFAVVYGGNSARQHMPIGGYFRTDIEAKHFQAQIKSSYPDCRIVRQGFYCVDEQEKSALLNHLLGGGV